MMKKDLRPTAARLGLAIGFTTVLAFSLAGCKSNTAPAPIIDNSGNTAVNGADPAAGNLAPVDGGQQGLASAPPQQRPTRVLGTSQSYTPQQTYQDYSQQQAPTQAGQAYDDNNYQDYDATPVYANQAPPPLPVYDQPAAPSSDYLWTPGYWDYANTGYYWVPGAWTAPPYRGALWTPGYWGRDGGRYRFHHGFWGLHIGYYGGIDYGYGYIGSGYYGGYWNRDHFYYNRSVNNVRFSNYVYERPVIVNNVRYTGAPVNRVSYNGAGGVQYRPRPYEIAAMREQHVPPMQTQHEVRVQAAGNQQQFFSNNHGRPAEAFATRPITASPGFTRQGGFGGNASNGQNNLQQQRAVQEGQRQQENLQRQGQAQQVQNQRLQNEQQRQQQVQQAQNQRIQNEQVRQQQVQQRQQQNVQNEQLRQQQVQQRQQQNVQAQQGRQQAEQQRQQVQQRGQQNAQQQQVRQQELQGRQQQMQQRQQPQAQPEHVQPRVMNEVPRSAPQQQPRVQQQAAPQTHVETPRVAPQPQHVETPRAAPQPQHVEAPRAAPQPQHVEAPHAAAPHAEGPHGEGHPR